MNFIKFHSEKNFIISGVCLSGVCLVRSLSRQEFVFPEFVFPEFVFQEFVSAPLIKSYILSMSIIKSPHFCAVIHRNDYSQQLLMDSAVAEFVGVDE